MTSMSTTGRPGNMRAMTVDLPAPPQPAVRVRTGFEEDEVVMARIVPDVSSPGEELADAARETARDEEGLLVLAGAQERDEDGGVAADLIEG